MPDRALFVALEGGEGAGKSTLQRALLAMLAAERRPAVATREPGGTPIGEILRQIIRKPAFARRLYSQLGDQTPWQQLSPTAELLLFAAARAQHVDGLIAPALANGATVICDRFSDSTAAYQGYGRGLPAGEIAAAISLATRGLRPDVVVLLDVPVAVGLARKQGESGRDQIGQETMAFHERVRAGYLECAQQEPGRWLVVDACQPAEVLAQVTWDATGGLRHPPRRF